MFGLADTTDVFLLQNAVKAHAEALEEMRKEIRELRAACVVTDYAISPASLRSILCGAPIARVRYTAIEAIQLLLEHSGVVVEHEPAKSEVKKLSPVKKAKR